MIIITVREPFKVVGETKTRLVKTLIKGRQFQDPNSDDTIELFRVKHLARAMDRNTTDVRKWLRNGTLPTPIFHVAGGDLREKNPNRPLHWFSASQLLNINRLYINKYGGKKYRGCGIQQLLEDIKSIWYCRDVVVADDGSIKLQESHNE